MNVIRGRPRDQGKELAVRAAVRKVLQSRGYAAATVPAVAREAGVGAPTVYRRWPSQVELVETVFEAHETSEVELEGSFADVVRQLVRTVVEFYGDPSTRAAIPGLLVEYHLCPERYEALVARSEAPLRARFAAVHRAAVAAGDIASTPGPDVLFDMIVGTAIFHGVVRNTADEDLVDSLVGAVRAAARRS